jgi:hypothetical protein
LKEHNKYDRAPLGLLNLLQRIVLLADKVADEVICEETDNLEKAIPRIFEVMQRVAEFSCDYVKRGRFGRPPPFLGLRIAGTGGGLAHAQKIEEMERELTEVIKDFDCVVNVEALCLDNESGKHSLSRSHNLNTSM